MTFRRAIAAPLTLLLSLAYSSGSSISLAHGVMLESTIIPAFRVQARYDSGEPMANAQVNVYAPNDPQAVWLQTLTDDQGYFLFTPDPSLEGTWDVQVRLAGHGEFLSLNVEEDGSVQQLSQGGNSTTQKWTTIAAVVWGFVGTALFFARKRPS